MRDQRKRDAIQGEIVHEYDGIEEADNRLPQWWLWTFYVAIAFSVGYWTYYESVGVGSSPLDRYTADRMAALDSGAPVSEEALLGLAADRLTIRAGEKVFGQNCAKCHGSGAEGNIGPNLTDEYWIGDGSPLAIYATITEGRGGKGMPAWGLQLGRGVCQQVAAYVLTLRNTRHPGKPPQGRRWEPPPAAPAPAAPPAAAAAAAVTTAAIR